MDPLDHEKGEPPVAVGELICRQQNEAQALDDAEERLDGARTLAEFSSSWVARLSLRL
jgi:hypothetical protein